MKHLILAAALALAASAVNAQDWIQRIRATAAPYEEIVHVEVRKGVDEPVLFEQHAADIGAIIAALAARFPGAEFYLVGTSKGTVSAAALGARLGAKIAGVVLTSTVTQASRGGEGLSGFDFGKLNVPVLLMHHKSDACHVTPYYAVERIAKEYRIPLVTVTGSDGARGAYCQAFSYHGYAGRESEVAAAIVQWVNKRAVAPTIE